MSGVHFTTISPSSTSSRRNTPWVDGGCGPIEIVVFVQQDLEPEPLITRGRKQVIVDFKTWLCFRPTIESAQVGEEIKFETRSYFHETARGHYVLAWNRYRRLAQRFDNIGGPIRVFTLKRRRDQRRRVCLLGVTGLIVLDCLLSVLFFHLTLRFPGHAQNDLRFSCREAIVYGLGSTVSGSRRGDPSVTGSVPGVTASRASLSGTSRRSRTDSFITLSCNIITA